MVQEEQASGRLPVPTCILLLDIRRASRVVPERREGVGGLLTLSLFLGEQILSGIIDLKQIPNSNYKYMQTLHDHISSQEETDFFLN